MMAGAKHGLPGATGRIGLAEIGAGFVIVRLSLRSATSDMVRLLSLRPPSLPDGRPPR